MSLVEKIISLSERNRPWGSKRRCVGRSEEFVWGKGKKRFTNIHLIYFDLAFKYVLNWNMITILLGTKPILDRFHDSGMCLRVTYCKILNIETVYQKLRKYEHIHFDCIFSGPSLLCVCAWKSLSYFCLPLSKIIITCHW